MCLIYPTTTALVYVCTTKYYALFLNNNIITFYHDEIYIVFVKPGVFTICKRTDDGLNCENNNIAFRVYCRQSCLRYENNENKVFVDIDITGESSTRATCNNNIIVKLILYL